MKSFSEWTMIKEDFFAKKEILHNAIKTGDIDEVRNLLDSGHSPDQTTIQLATMSGNPELAKLVRDAYRAMMTGG
jgi:hypothetical protein